MKIFQNWFGHGSAGSVFRNTETKIARLMSSSPNRQHNVAKACTRTCFDIVMKTRASTFIRLIAVASCFYLAADSTAQQPSSAGSEKAASVKPKLTQEELEAKFKATLTKATMTGRWCGVKEGRLTPEKEDKYTIVSVTKLGGEAWIIHSRIQYGNKDFVAPIPVQVKWAGDTPVITLDNVGMPGGGNSYSARVLIYDKTYAGTWSGGDHVGLLNGVITNGKD